MDINSGDRTEEWLREMEEMMKQQRTLRYKMFVKRIDMKENPTSNAFLTGTVGIFVAFFASLPLIALIVLLPLSYFPL